MRCVPPIRVFVGAAAIVGPSVALAQPVPDYDFQWATIGNVGNAPYTSSSPDDLNVNGRGSVNYEFRASKLEITTAQWMEFVNAFAPFENSPIDQTGPVVWAARRAELLPSGHYRMELWDGPNAEILPVAGLSWRDAARYCNWLHNNKEVSLAAISTGAYDTSTWGNRPGGGYTDDPRRMPGATFFLPEISEYLKATHYDPNRYGPGQGGYWLNKAMSDIPLIPGLPGEGQTSAGYQPDGNPHAAWGIALGAYTDVQTAYGLFDTSGAAAEWVESWTEQVLVNGRMYVGSYAGMNPESIEMLDRIGRVSADGSLQNPATDVSFRIYSIPSPGTSMLLVSGVWFARRKRSSVR